MAIKALGRKLSEAELNAPDLDEGVLDVETYPLPDGADIADPYLREVWEAVAAGMNGETKEINLSAAWDESQHARDHGKFSSKPGAKGESGKSDPAPEKPAPRPMSEHAANIHKDYTLDQWNEYARLRGPDGNSELHFSEAFMPKLIDSVTANLEGHAKDAIETINSATEEGDYDACVKAANDFYSIAEDAIVTTLGELGEKSLGEMNEAEQKAFDDAINECTSYIEENLHDFRDAEDDDHGIYAQAFARSIPVALADLKLAVKDVREMQADRAREQDEAEQQATNDHLEELEGVDQEDGLEDATRANADLEETGNRYRIFWDADEEEWGFADAEDLETWPGKKADLSADGRRMPKKPKRAGEKIGRTVDLGEPPPVPPGRSDQESASRLVDQIIDRGAAAGVVVADDLRERLKDLLSKKKIPPMNS